MGLDPLVLPVSKPSITAPIPDGSTLPPTCDRLIPESSCLTVSPATRAYDFHTVVEDSVENLHHPMLSSVNVFV